MSSQKIFDVTRLVTARGIDIQDSGMAQIFEVDNYTGDETELFVRVQSYSNSKNHSVMDSLHGKRIRVTIEVLDD